MGTVTAERLAEQAVDLGLLTPHQMQDVWSGLGTRSVSVDHLVQALVRRDLLTKYQVDRLTSGQKTGFFYGDYKVLYLVGAGGFARVFRAVHRETGQVVAIKALRNHYSDQPSQFGMFVREGELGQTLRHPNIVPIYEVYSDRAKRLHYFVMEFVEGRNLREFIKIRKQLDPIEATRLMADIARGLDYAFQRSVTHRDLKMSNVFVSSHGEAKLVDFGLAAIDENASMGVDGEPAAARTIDYAALERATGVRRDDPRSDIYFAGCIFYHMLYGRPPLDDVPGRVQRLNRSRFADVVPIQDRMPSLPFYLAAIVNRSMSMEPARRYQTPGEMLADLEAALNRPQSDEQSTEPSEPSIAVEAAPPVERPIMVVEANVEMQNMLRDGLRKAGYRVLLTSDPRWAYDRLTHEPGIVDGVLISADPTSDAAIDWFNNLLSHPWTENLPAMLLLPETQRGRIDKVKTASHRMVLALPMTMKDLRAALATLVPPSGGGSESNAFTPNRIVGRPHASVMSPLAEGAIAVLIRISQVKQV